MKRIALKFLLDQKDLCFIDLAVNSDNSLKEIHEAVLKASNWSGKEMASFFLLDEEQEIIEEFPVEAFDPAFQGRKMHEVKVGELIHEIGDQLSYTYDYLNEYKFFIESTQIEPIGTQEEIKIEKVFGKIPKESGDTLGGKSAESILMDAILGDEFDLEEEDDDLGDDLFDHGSFDSIDDYEDFL